MLAVLAGQAMNASLSLSVEACSTFVTCISGCSNNMLRQCFNSCGRQTYMGLGKYVIDCLGVYHDIVFREGI